MHREGHFGLNALLYAPIAFLTAMVASVELAVVGAMFFVGTASLPDFDRHFDNNMKTNRSKLWTLVPIKHRGFTHTIWFALLIGVLGTVLAVAMAPLAESQPPEVVAVFGGGAAFCGILGHILGDAMTPMGVRPFNPIGRKKYSLGWFLAKNPFANYGFLIIGGIALLAALGYGFSETGLDLSNYMTVVWIL